MRNLKLSDEKINMILEFRKQRKSITEIAELMGVGTTTVLRYINPSYKKKQRIYLESYKQANKPKIRKYFRHLVRRKSLTRHFEKYLSRRTEGWTIADIQLFQYFLEALIKELYDESNASKILQNMRNYHIRF